VGDNQQAVSGHDAQPVRVLLLTLGFLSIAAGIFGGQIKGAGFELPGISSLVGRFLLGIVGIVFVSLGLVPTWAPTLRRLAKLTNRAESRSPQGASDVGIPPDRNPHFAGRGTELAQIHSRLRELTRLAVIGPPGIGKTQIAVEYIHRHRESYPQGVFWIRGDDQSTLRADFAALSTALELPESKSSNQEVAIAAARRWLFERPGWLVVVDNLEVRQELETSLLSRGLPGSILVTSRSSLWTDAIEVGPLPTEVATALLIARTKQADETAAAELAAELGCLPLALEQAGAYMTETKEPMRGYLAMLRQRPAAVLAEGIPIDYPRTVASTIALSFHRIRRESRTASDILGVCAFLAPEEIPITLLSAGALSTRSPLGPATDDPLQLNRVIAILLSYSVVGRQGDSLSMHRIIQTVVRDLGAESRARSWARAAVRLLLAAFPTDVDDEGNWPICSRLLPHALTAYQHAVEAGMSEAEDLRVRVGNYLVIRQIVLSADSWIPYVDMGPTHEVVAHRDDAYDRSLTTVEQGASISRRKRDTTWIAAIAAIAATALIGVAIAIGAWGVNRLFSQGNAAPARNTTTGPVASPTVVTTIPNSVGTCVQFRKHDISIKAGVDGHLPSDEALRSALAEFNGQRAGLVDIYVTDVNASAGVSEAEQLDTRLRELEPTFITSITIIEHGSNMDGDVAHRGDVELFVYLVVAC
jgi:hypothetical protein